jgi:hypothetical protein
LTILNNENIDEKVVFYCENMKTDIKGSTAIQCLGGSITYIERYLFLMAFQISENDFIDAQPQQAEQVKRQQSSIEKYICCVCGKEVQKELAHGSLKKYGKVFCSGDCKSQLDSNTETTEIAG